MKGLDLQKKRHLLALTKQFLGLDRSIRVFFLTLQWFLLFGCTRPLP